MYKEIERQSLLERIEQAFKVNRIVCLLGPRQCGKTTVARKIWAQSGRERKEPGYFDLENPSDLEALENPDLVLPPLQDLIVIDEIQRKPDLFAYLRYLHDEQLNQQFLILGSASRDLIQQSSESLSGRITYIEVTPFLISEIDDIQRLWVQGGFPKSYLLDNEYSYAWRGEYMRTYIEQDLAQLGFSFDTQLLRRLWFMLAHYHGQTLNGSEIAHSLGVSQPTVKKYLSFLEGSFMLRQLKPWFENLKKRQVKSPKLYFRDSGLLHYVLGVKNYHDIFVNPKAGASWEGYALEEVIQSYQVDENDCYFWASHNNAELDLLIIKNGRKLGFEFKLSDAPKITPSMHIAMNDLSLDSLSVIYPGQRRYNLEEKITVIPLSQITRKK